MVLADDSAEEYFSRRMHDAQTLEAAARAFAHPAHGTEQNAVSALACALGADVAVIEAVVWERVHFAPRDPRRDFFGVAETLTGRLGQDGPGEDAATVRDIVEANRQSIIATFDDPLTDSLAGRWPAISYLSDVPVPTSAALIGSAMQRLDGLSPDEYVTRQRAAALTVHKRADAERAADLLEDALRSYYEGDRLAIDAYLVESAAAVGDRTLLSVIVRSVLVDRALDDIGDLPDDMDAALAEIRATIATAMGSADGERFLAFLTEC